MRLCWTITTSMAWIMNLMLSRHIRISKSIKWTSTTRNSFWLIPQTLVISHNSSQTMDLQEMPLDLWDRLKRILIVCRMLNLWERVEVKSIQMLKNLNQISSHQKQLMPLTLINLTVIWTKRISLQTFMWSNWAT